MAIFLTGSTGFLGRNLLELLVKQEPNRPIIGLVRNPDRAKNQWPQPPANIQWIKGDLLEPDTYRHALRQSEVVLHLAALVGLKNGREFYAQNTEATRQLVQELKSSPPLRRLVFTSSISAVDRPFAGPFTSPRKAPATEPLTESAICQPQTDYGRSKLEAEQLITQSGLPYSILIPAYIYGPHLRPGSSTERLIQDMRSGKRYTRFPFPGAVSEIYAEDLAEALWIAATHPNTLNERFFISNPQPVPMVTALTELAQALGVHHAFSPEPEASNLDRYRTSQPSSGANPLLRRILWEGYFTCSSAKWFQATSHQPKTGFSQGIQKTVSHYFANALSRL